MPSPAAVRQLTRQAAGPFQHRSRTWSWQSWQAPRRPLTRTRNNLGSVRTTWEEHVMFADTEAFSGFSVSDIDEARKFYAETLGLRVTEQYGLLTLRLAGGRDTL